MPDTLYCKPIHVADAISLSKELAAEPLKGSRIQVQLYSSISSIRVVKKEYGKEFIKWPEADLFASRCVDLGIEKINKFNVIKYTKDNQNRDVDAASILCENQGDLVCKVTINKAEGFGDDIDEVIKLFAKYLNTGDREGALQDTLPPYINDITSQRERNVIDLEDSLKRLERTTADLFTEQAKNALEFQNKLAEQADEQRKKLDGEYVARRKELDDERDEFEKKRRDLDDRDSREVRRELKEQMLDAIDTEFAVRVPDSVRGLRTPTFVACWLAMSLGIVMMVGSAIKVASNPMRKSFENLYFDLPSLQIFTPGALLFGSTLIFYLRWSDRWFRDHADAEFKNQQLKHDVLRASWVAEFVVEASKDESVTIPEKLLETMSRELFTDSSRGAAHHPTDDITKLLRKVTRLKIAKGAFEIEKPAEKIDSQD